VALVKLGGLAQDVRGTLNGSVFSRNRGGAYIRSKVSPVQPVSQWSALHRDVFAAVAQRWAAVLSASQRADWNTFATLHPFINVFGDSITLSGVSMFEAVNRRTRSIGYPWIDEPPATFVVGDMGSLSVVAKEVANVLTTLSITCTSAPSYPGGLYVFGTVPLAPGRKVQKSQYRLVNGPMDLLYASGLNIYSQYLARFPGVLWPPGSTFGLLVCWMNPQTGAIGPGYSLRPTVVAGP
jgi:hypothetical protein